MNEQRLRRFAVGVGVLLLLEGLALAVGVRLTDPSNPWVSPKNDLLLSLDLLVGAVLCWFGRRSEVGEWPSTLGSILLVAVVVHGFRVWEVVAGRSDAFVTSTPLVAVTLVKLVGVGVVFVAFARYRADRRTAERLARGE
ncbi:hypothetical protein [Halomarina oriensis]|uniref:Uncharacterized protein n=1 Tax=Halomarina oriensis TaxID=671145 RepID=A0A6B0GXZ8_9EURY|nr:hypothetical protein [Halomarina oriensis]MWG36658.1 hypothetical protein [Halomarina oriensis]